MMESRGTRSSVGRLRLRDRVKRGAGGQRGALSDRRRSVGRRPTLNGSSFEAMMEGRSTRSSVGRLRLRERAKRGAGGQRGALSVRRRSVGRRPNLNGSPFEAMMEGRSTRSSVGRLRLRERAKRGAGGQRGALSDRRRSVGRRPTLNRSSFEAMIEGRSTRSSVG